MKKVSILMLLVFVFVTLAESLAFADLSIPIGPAGAVSISETIKILPDGGFERKTETVIEPSIKGGIYGATGGAATGAVIGSFIPVIGTAIGAGVGALAGGIAGWIFGPVD